MNWGWQRLRLRCCQTWTTACSLKCSCVMAAPTTYTLCLLPSPRIHALVCSLHCSPHSPSEKCAQLRVELIQLIEFIWWRHCTLCVCVWMCSMVMRVYCVWHQINGAIIVYRISTPSRSFSDLVNLAKWRRTSDFGFWGLRVSHFLFAFYSISTTHR